MHCPKALIPLLFAVSLPSIAQTAPSQLLGGGMARMQQIMEEARSTAPSGDNQLDAATRGGQESARAAASLQGVTPQIIDFNLQHSKAMEQATREAYVKAMPKRDQARGAALLLNDGTLPGHNGRLLIFVSRSMPMSMLRAYAMDAMYLGAPLVVKGLRKGQTVKEYVEESVEQFNSVDGQHLASMEINPNLFDMFDVKVVPTVVWTNRVGLDDINSSCDEPAGPPEMVSFMGPHDVPIEAERPTCAKAPESSYYKIAGSLNMDYVLDRFEAAGLAKEATAPFRAGLLARAGGVVQYGEQAPVGNYMAPVRSDTKIERMPRHILEAWQESLAEENVARSPYGPVFGEDQEDDPEYRRELQERVTRGLALPH